MEKSSGQPMASNVNPPGYYSASPSYSAQPYAYPSDGANPYPTNPQNGAGHPYQGYPQGNNKQPVFNQTYPPVHPIQFAMPIQAPQSQFLGMDTRLLTIGLACLLFAYNANNLIAIAILMAQYAIFSAWIIAGIIYEIFFACVIFAASSRNLGWTRSCFYVSILVVVVEIIWESISFVAISAYVFSLFGLLILLLYFVALILLAVFLSNVKKDLESAQARQQETP
jgi:hypothetical protein